MWPPDLKALPLPRGHWSPTGHATQQSVCQKRSGDTAACLQGAAVLFSSGESLSSFPVGCFYVFGFLSFFFLSFFGHKSTSKIYRNILFHMNYFFLSFTKKKTLGVTKKHYVLLKTRKVGIFVFSVATQYLVSHLGKIPLTLNWVPCCLPKELHFPVSFTARRDHVTKL